MKSRFSRRSLLQVAGAMPAMAAFPDRPIEYQTAPGPAQESAPKYKINFAVIGIDHNHINGITDAVRRGGGTLISVYSDNPQALAAYRKRYPDVKVAASEDEILNDKSIQLVCSAAIPDQRARIGIAALRHGKDYLSDKPAITTLDQLAQVRRAIEETKRIFAIMYSERLEVRAAQKATELVQAGAIGKVIQTINIAPHVINPETRPAWFWDDKRFGGILVDIGSHQADQFVFYTNSTTADVTASQIANVNHKQYPHFQDFGDMMVHGNGGFGYVRVDWFTPHGLSTWGDGRLFILGTDGYIELRKYIDIAGRPGGNHLFIVDQKSTRYIDCNKVDLPFGPLLVADIVNRTRVAQDQQQALLATELVLKAQKNAKVL